MKHREILSQEENTAVAKFQEYNATVQLSFGSKANWAEIVHQQNLYSDDLLAKKVSEYRAKVNAQAQAEDEDGVPAPMTEFSILDGQGERVEFTTEDCLLFVRAARKCRKHMATLVANKAEIAKLTAEMAKLKRKTQTPAEALAEMQAKLDALQGKKPENTAAEQDKE